MTGFGATGVFVLMITVFDLQGHCIMIWEDLCHMQL